MTFEADLRACASCRFIFRRSETDDDACPECKFGHYSARFVFGRAAYKFEKTQQPWVDNQVRKLREELRQRVCQRKVTAVTKELKVTPNQKVSWL